MYSGVVVSQAPTAVYRAVYTSLPPQTSRPGASKFVGGVEVSKKVAIYTLTPFVCALLADPREGLHLAPEPDQLPEQLQNTIESALRRGARADERGLFPQKMDAYISVPPSPAVAGAVANPLPPRQQLHRWRRRHRRYYRLWRVEHFSGLFIIENWDSSTNWASSATSLAPRNATAVEVVNAKAEDSAHSGSAYSC